MANVVSLATEITENCEFFLKELCGKVEGRPILLALTSTGCIMLEFIEEIKDEADTAKVTQK